MAKHLNIYQDVVSKVGLREDQEYQRLYNPEDKFGESLQYLAVRNFKRFIAVLNYLIKRNEFDLLLFGGDSGIGLSKITELVYEQLDKKPPTMISLPIIRMEPKWLDDHGQEVKKFDNSIFIPQIKDRVNSLNKLENLAFIDDEIGKGITARAIVNLAIETADENKLQKPLNLTILAEDQNFNPENFLENVNCDIYPFATQNEEIYNVLCRVVPWSIQKQIRDHFTNEQMG
jgi:hypothetical protein